jgi:hypothetical protein
MCNSLQKWPLTWKWISVPSSRLQQCVRDPPVYRLTCLAANYDVMVQPSTCGSSVITTRLMTVQVSPKRQAQVVVASAVGFVSRTSRIATVPHVQDFSVGLYCILWTWKMLSTYFCPENGVSMYLRNDDIIMCKNPRAELTFMLLFNFVIFYFR